MDWLFLDLNLKKKIDWYETVYFAEEKMYDKF